MSRIFEVGKQYKLINNLFSDKEPIDPVDVTILKREGIDYQIRLEQDSIIGGNKARIGKIFGADVSWLAGANICPEYLKLQNNEK